MITYTSSGFKYRGPGISVSRSSNDCEIRVERRGFKWSEFVNGDLHEIHVSVRRGNRALEVDNNGSNRVRVREEMCSPEGGTIAGYYYHDREGYVLTGPHYATDPYNGCMVLRGGTRYFTDYGQWLDAALLLEEEIATLRADDITRPPVRPRRRAVFDASMRTIDGNLLADYCHDALTGETTFVPIPTRVEDIPISDNYRFFPTQPYATN